MIPDGKFGADKPKSQGRSKWKLVDENLGKEVDISSSFCIPIKSRSLKKTLDADKEEWDIIDDGSDPTSSTSEKSFRSATHRSIFEDDQDSDAAMITSSSVGPLRTSTAMKPSTEKRKRQLVAPDVPLPRLVATQRNREVSVHLLGKRLYDPNFDYSGRSSYQPSRHALVKAPPPVPANNNRGRDRSSTMRATRSDPTPQQPNTTSSGRMMRHCKSCGRPSSLCNGAKGGPLGGFKNCNFKNDPLPSVTDDLMVVLNGKRFRRGEMSPLDAPSASARASPHRRGRSLYSESVSEASVGALSSGVTRPTRGAGKLSSSQSRPVGRRAVAPLNLAEPSTDTDDDYRCAGSSDRDEDYSISSSGDDNPRPTKRQRTTNNSLAAALSTPVSRRRNHRACRSGGGFYGDVDSSGEDAEDEGEPSDEESSSTSDKGGSSSGQVRRGGQPWTNEERSAFYKAYKKYGKEFESFTSMIPTRTIIQIRAFWSASARKILSPNTALTPPRVEPKRKAASESLLDRTLSQKRRRVNIRCRLT